MKYSTLVTARRLEEIYPPWVSKLAYNKENELVGYLLETGEFVTEINQDSLEFNDLSSIELVKKYTQGVSDLLQEVEELKQAKPKETLEGAESFYMCSFSLNKDDPEIVYGLESKKEAEAMLKRNMDKYGEKSVSDVEIKKYKIVWV